MERFGFVGLPNAGKSSLFNALAGGGALAAPYPFATKEPNVGRARVPDTRLDQLAAFSKSKNVVHAVGEFVDIGGLVEGAHKGEGSRQQVPRQHPRGRRHRLRRPGLRGRRRPRLAENRSTTSPSSRSSSPLPTSRRSRPSCPPPEGGEGRQDAGRRAARHGEGARDPLRRHAAVPGAAHRRGARRPEAAVPADEQARAGGRQRRRRRPRPRRREGRPRRRAHGGPR